MNRRIGIAATTAAVLCTAVVGCAAPEASTTATTSASAQMTPVATTTPVPVGLEIPAIDLITATPLTPLGLDKHNRIEVPDIDHPEVGGWFSRGPRPGDRGPAVLLAHVDGSGRPGLFARLHELTPGAQVTVIRADESRVEFTVSRVDQYRKLAFPTEAVYGDTPDPQLRLITCGGEFNAEVRSHVDNIVVSAALASTT